MSPKITFIGAGSTVFAKNLLGDILSYPELAESTITLMDIDPERLRTTRVVAERTAQALGAHPKIEATLDRRLALDGADYAISMFQIGGYKPGTVIDFEIPKKYGLRQTIADTLGIGGIFRALRTIPVFLEITKEMAELCPDVTFLNYVNPMAMITWAINRGSKIKTVGLCHSVQGTAEQLAHDIGVPIEEINYVCAGINHMAFYLRFERKTASGVEDLYPRIRQVVAEGRVPNWNRVRYEMLMRLGFFVTESSEHFSEYTPYFIKRDRPDLIEKFNVPLDEYITRCEVQLAGWEFMQHKIDHPSATRGEMREMMEQKAQTNPYLTPRFIELMLDEAEEFESGKIERSHEYGSGIIHSCETGEPRVVYGNVPNHSLIDNLPQGCCVEVPVLVDKNGLQPVKIGALPPQLAAMMQTNINVQSLTVEAALTGKKEHIYHAAMLDPHTAAELDLEQIWNLVDDLLAAHKGWLPEFN
jgi:alpha-galactosidase